MFLQEYRVDGFRYDQNMVIDDDGGAEGWPFLQDLTNTLNVFYVHENDRIIAWHRWLEGMGCDVVMVASLNEVTFSSYQLGMPQGGEWREVFNSDVYDHYPNPQTAGNGGILFAGGASMHGLPCSATVVIPANSIMVFTRG